MNHQNDIRTLFDLYKKAAKTHPELISFIKRRGDDQIEGYSFKELKNLVSRIACGLNQISVQNQDKILFLCDNSNHWLITTVGIITAGGVCVPRATDVTNEDIRYIANHSEARFAIVQNEKTFNKLIRLIHELPRLSKDRIFILEDEKGYFLKNHPLSFFDNVIQKGEEILQKNPDFIEFLNQSLDPHQLAILIYTSGTTGIPKGVMLNQKGWIESTKNSFKKLPLKTNDVAISLLPPWHAFEQIVEFVFLYFPITFIITDINQLRRDLEYFKPTVMPSVPRIWESVYNGILNKIKKESIIKQKIFNFALKIGIVWNHYILIFQGADFQIQKKPIIKEILHRLTALLIMILLSPLKLFTLIVFRPIKKALGGRFRSSLSGGSALPKIVDQFLNAIGLQVAEGYGMTETCGVISVRDFNKPTPGTVGTPLEGYEIKLINEEGKDVKHIPGEKGTLWVKSPQVTMGYYKRDDLNKTVFDKDGFFDTGDIMRINWRGQLFFAGRAKDTIVLAGGENIEPLPIEDTLLQSEYINQVMVVGDEKKTLGVLIVPNFELVKQIFPEAPNDYTLWNQNPLIRQLFKNEIAKLINQKNGFKSFELIPKDTFYIVPREFDPEKEMTKTLKIKRPIIKEHFKNEIEEMYKNQ